MLTLTKLILFATFNQNRIILIAFLVPIRSQNEVRINNLTMLIFIIPM